MSTNWPPDFCPYKGLQPYTEEDRAFFFGRERDQRIIISNLFAAPLTVFYGASGVGKSSVLLAGAVPQLKQERNLTVVVFRNWQDPAFLSQLKQETLAAVDKTSNKELNIDLSASLDDFLAELARAARGSIFFVFDQFEEYFLYNPPGPNSEAFEAEFARVINRRDIDAHFLLSMREDGLSKLDRFQGRIPALLNNMLRLERLDRVGSQAAITQPLEVYNQGISDGQGPVTIEPELVEAVLDDMRGVKANSDTTASGRLQDLSFAAPAAQIETPLLQMILTRLWQEERAAGSRVLRLQTFEALGRAENIARTHLDTMMSRLNDSEINHAAHVLRYMVTPSGTKIAQEASALASWTELNEEQTRSILARLSSADMRILRIMQNPGQPPLYEIFHDVLAQAILNWRRRYVACQQEEKIRREEQERIKKDQAEAERRFELERAGRLRKVVIGLSIMLLVMIGLVVWAYRERVKAIAAEIREVKSKETLKAIMDKELEEARKESEEAKNREESVRAAAVHLRYSLAHRQKKEWEKAIEECNKAIELDPKSATAYSSKGYSQMRVGEKAGGRYEEAIKTLEYLTSKVDPHYAFGHYNLALTYYKNGQLSKAIAEAETVIKLDPTFCKTFEEDLNYQWFRQTREYLDQCSAKAISELQ
jgi:tetratricopeptide (TPR) repeat protein